MKVKRIQILSMAILLVVIMLGLMVGNPSKTKNVRTKLENMNTLTVLTNKRRYTAKEVFPIRIHTSGEYKVTTTHGKISLTKSKNFTKTLKTESDQIIYVKLNAKEDTTKITIKNSWNQKNMTIKLENGYYVIQNEK